MISGVFFFFFFFFAVSSLLEIAAAINYWKGNVPSEVL